MSSIVNPKAVQQSTIQFAFQHVNGTLKPKDDEKCEIAFFNGLNNAETTWTVSPFSTSTGVTIQYNSSNALCSLRALCDAGRLMAALTMLEGMEYQGIKIVAPVADGINGIHLPLHGGDTWIFGGEKMQVIKVFSTPDHTKGHVSLYFPNQKLLTGYTLFSMMWTSL